MATKDKKKFTPDSVSEKSTNKEQKNETTIKSAFYADADAGADAYNYVVKPIIDIGMSIMPDSDNQSKSKEMVTPLPGLDSNDITEKQMAAIKKYDPQIFDNIIKNGVTGYKLKHTLSQINLVNQITKQAYSLLKFYLGQDAPGLTDSQRKDLQGTNGNIPQNQLAYLLGTKPQFVQKPEREQLGDKALMTALSGFVSQIFQSTSGKQRQAPGTASSAANIIGAGAKYIDTVIANDKKLAYITAVKNVDIFNKYRDNIGKALAELDTRLTDMEKARLQYVSSVINRNTQLLETKIKALENVTKRGLEEGSEIAQKQDQLRFDAKKMQSKEKIEMTKIRRQIAKDKADLIYKRNALYAKLKEQQAKNIFVLNDKRPVEITSAMSAWTGQEGLNLTNQALYGTQITQQAAEAVGAQATIYGNMVSRKLKELMPDTPDADFDRFKKSSDLYKFIVSMANAGYFFTEQAIDEIVEAENMNEPIQIDIGTKDFERVISGKARESFMKLYEEKQVRVSSGMKQAMLVNQIKGLNDMRNTIIEKYKNESFSDKERMNMQYEYQQITQEMNRLYDNVSGNTFQEVQNAKAFGAISVLTTANNMSSHMYELANKDKTTGQQILDLFEKPVDWVFGDTNYREKVKKVDELNKGRKNINEK